MTSKAVALNWMSKLRLLGTTALLVTALAACAGSPTRESTGQFIDDSTATSKVKSALLEDKVTRGLAVHVETFKGTVELSGFVDTTQDRERAAQIASSVDGVRSVANRLVVKSGGY
jgi:hyperosmotically inducible periplasmic protein